MWKDRLASTLLSSPMENGMYESTRHSTRKYRIKLFDSRTHLSSVAMKVLVRISNSTILFTLFSTRIVLCNGVRLFSRFQIRQRSSCMPRVGKAIIGISNTNGHVVCATTNIACAADFDLIENLFAVRSNEVLSAQSCTIVCTLSNPP